MCKIIIIFHCLTSDTDPTGPRRLLRHRGKTCNLQEEKPYSWGRKNPISHLSRIKNPDLPYPSIAAALRAYILHPSSLDVLATLGTTASFSSLLRLGFTISQLYLANCLLCLITIALFPIFCLSPICYFLLTINYYYIHYTSSPPKAY